jgi:ABC-type sugar transport system substrate-binding protein
MRRRGIALFLRSLDNDYQQRLRDDALTAAKRSGFTVTIFSAQNDGARQVAQIGDLVDGPEVAELAAVLVSPVRDEGLEELARRCAQRGIGWVLLNRDGQYVEDLRNEMTGLPVFGVTPDQDQIGRIQAEQVRLLLPRGGLVVCISGPGKTSSAQRRLEGMRARLGASHQLTVIEADWTTEGARLALDRWLTDADVRGLPEVVCAQNDEMALGARQALRDVASRRDLPLLAGLPITGCDGSPAVGQKMVKGKRLWATVVVPSAAGPAIEWLGKWRESGLAPPAHLTLPVSSFPDLPKIRAVG